MPDMAITYKLYEHPVRQFIRDRAPDGRRGRTGDGLAWFAEKIGTSPSQLSRVINGRVPLTHEMAVRIANGLDVAHEAVYVVEFDADEPRGVTA